MELMSSAGPRLGAILASAPVEHAAAVLGILLALTLTRATYTLAAEWQRRRTFEAILAHAPGGSVIVQGRSKSGPALWIWVGKCQVSVVERGSSPCRVPEISPHQRTGLGQHDDR